MSEISDLDERLDQARTAYYQAIDEGRLDVADLAYAQMDSLLEQRLHVPLQRIALVGESGPELLNLAPGTAIRKTS